MDICYGVTGRGTSVGATPVGANSHRLQGSLGIEQQSLPGRPTWPKVCLSAPGI